MALDRLKIDAPPLQPLSLGLIGESPLLAERGLLRDSFTDVSSPPKIDYEARRNDPLAQKSGQFMIQSGFRADPSNPDETQEDFLKRQRRLFRFEQGFRQMALDTEDVVGHLKKSIEDDWKYFNQRHDGHIKDSEMLRDDKGKLIKTVEEKKALEDEQGVCSAQYAQDEIIVNEGQRMPVALYDDIQRKEQAIADLEAGRITVDDLDPDLQQMVLDRAQGVDQTAPVAVGTILEQPKNETIAPQKPNANMALTPTF